MAYLPTSSSNLGLIKAVNVILQVLSTASVALYGYRVLLEGQGATMVLTLGTLGLLIASVFSQLWVWKAEGKDKGSDKGTAGGS